MKKLFKGLAVVTGVVGAAAVAVGVYEKLTGKNIVDEAKKYLDSLENDDSDYDFEEFGDWDEDEDDYDDYEGDDYDDSEDEEETESSEDENKKESEDDSIFVADGEDFDDEE